MSYGCILSLPPMPSGGGINKNNNMVFTYFAAGVVLVYSELVPLLSYFVGNQSQTVVVLVAGCSFVSGICILSFLLSAVF
jgi:hypothetical protein